MKTDARPGPPAAPARTWDAFNRFWGSQSCAQTASQVLYYAYPLIAAALLRLDPAEIAVTTFLQFLPTLVMTPIGGLIVDRADRRTLLLVCHLGRAALLAAAAGLAAADRLPTPLFWVLVAATGAVSSVADLTTLAVIPQVAPDGRLLTANSRMQLTLSVAQVLGPAAAGLLVGLSGAGVLGAIAGVFVMAGLLSLRVRPAAGPPPAAGEPWGSRFTRGARVVRADALLRALLVQGGLFNFFEQALITLYLIHALRTLGMSTTTVGLLLGVGAVGSVLGAAAAARLSHRWERTRLVALAMAFASVAPCALPLSPAGAPALAAATAALAFFSYGVGLTVFNVHSIAIRHESVAAEYQGRVGAVYRFCAFGGTALGAAFAGWLTSWLTPHTAMWIPCAGLLAALLLFVRSLRALPAPAATAAPAGA
ncbi:MFS transporter [Streptomyces sp. NPDC035033]|uniref:MFS transporter n=1 Tax=Streptomyces sp. NPDC035033 TaxID=3155368 RepID=UPI0033E2E6DE